MAFYTTYTTKKKFLATGGTVGEGNPTFEFSHAVCVDTENYIMVLGKASVSDVVVKSYSEQAPADFNGSKPLFLQLRINKKDWSDTYKEKVNKKVATPLDLYICSALSNFAHPVESWATFTEDDFKSASLGLEIDLGASAMNWLQVIEAKELDGNPLDDTQIMKIESKIVDFPVMLGSAFTLADVQDHLTKLAGGAKPGGSTGYSSGGGNYAKVNITEQKLTLLKEILHAELCDPKVTPTPADVKLSQIANDMTMITKDKLDNLKYLLGLIFN